MYILIDFKTGKDYLRSSELLFFIKSVLIITLVFSHYTLPIMSMYDITSSIIIIIYQKNISDWETELSQNIINCEFTMKYFIQYELQCTTVHYWN